MKIRAILFSFMLLLGGNVQAIDNIQLGPRPYFLIENMNESPLKTKLQQCAEGPFNASDFSIGHRGAALLFPEHTKESYVAAARMGAGILECDVTFTKDKRLVCRHSQCDLHTTTNILAVSELAAKCSEPFTPADPENDKKASAKCCTSDITLAEYKILCGKMDAANSQATTIKEYMNGTANWRSDLYSSCGTLMTHAESIQLFSELGTKFTPELKTPNVDMPYQGNYTQKNYAQQMINEYKAAGISPDLVFAQSFNLEDVLYWIAQEPEFGKQAVYLDNRVYKEQGYKKAIESMPQMAEQNVKYIAPPMWALLSLDTNQQIVPSDYAKAANAAGLNIITWTLERSGLLNSGGGWYYKTVKQAINNDGDALVALDVLAQQVGIKGIFSDWPATVTYYANCMDL